MGKGKLESVFRTIMIICIQNTRSSNRTYMYTVHMGIVRDDKTRFTIIFIIIYTSTRYYRIRVYNNHLSIQVRRLSYPSTPVHNTYRYVECHQQGLNVEASIVSETRFLLQPTSRYQSGTLSTRTHSYSRFTHDICRSLDRNLFLLGTHDASVRLQFVPKYTGTGQRVQREKQN